VLRREWAHATKPLMRRVNSLARVMLGRPREVSEGFDPAKLPQADKAAVLLPTTRPNSAVVAAGRPEAGIAPSSAEPLEAG
jgi:hypothetical protein